MTSVSVLLIEDSNDKVQLIASFLNAKCDGAKLEISSARDSASARRLLRRSHFDILVLDMALPLFPDEAPRPKAGLDFLREITLADDYFAPNYVVGITGHDDGFESLRSEFEKHGWPLYRSDPTTDGWLGRIAAIIKHIIHTRTKVVREVDFAIVTALYEPELIAILSLPWKWSHSEQLDEATMYRRGSLVAHGKEFSVIATWPQRMGLVVSAALTSKIIQHFRPRVLATSGICAGVRGKAALGDIILASEAWTWESGKIVSEPRPGTLQPDSHSFSASTKVVTIAQQLRSDNSWLSDVRKQWTGTPAVSNAPKLLIGPMASGSAVVADPQTVQDILAKSRKTTAIDMEAYAIYAAAALGGEPVPLCFCVKSVCDFADEHKDDSYQPYAAYTSARAVERICMELSLSLDQI